MHSFSERTVVVVADSTLGHTAFRYGIQLVLQSAGFRLLWLCVRPGAKAKDFSIMWEKAPKCDFGITIYNGNDFTSKDQLSENVIQDHLQSMVDTSSAKCGTNFFICNDPTFFPRLDSSHSGFRGRMQKAIEFLEARTQRTVWQCSAYLGRGKLWG